MAGTGLWTSAPVARCAGRPRARRLRVPGPSYQRHWPFPTDLRDAGTQMPPLLSREGPNSQSQGCGEVGALLVAEGSQWPAPVVRQVSPVTMHVCAATHRGQKGRVCVDLKCLLAASQGLQTVHTGLGAAGALRDGPGTRCAQLLGTGTGTEPTQATGHSRAKESSSNCPGVLHVGGQGGGWAAAE